MAPARLAGAAAAGPDRPGGAPRVLPRTVELLPAEVRGLLGDGSALSLLYFGGVAIGHDWR